jgi:SAM-dependent methyltransferase
MLTGPVDTVTTFVTPLPGAAILDVGCGRGQLVRRLREFGARSCGIDPNPEAIADAKASDPDLDVRVGVAEELPFQTGAFRAVTFINALHHVPVARQVHALEEARRVLAPAGRLIVLEPLASGSFFSALRLIEDETEVRVAAADALRSIQAAGLFRLDAGEIIIRRETFADCQAFIDRVVSVDPSRAAAVARNRAGIDEAILAAAERLPDGRLLLEQPIRVDVLSIA